MWRPDLAALACAAGVLVVGPAGADDSLRLDRVEARQRALARAPALARGEAARAAARALSAPSYPHRPELTLELESDGSPLATSEYVRRMAVEQELDLRGERGALRRLGGATATAVERELEERSLAIAAAVDLSYSRHLVARRRAALLEPLRDRARILREKAEAARRRETVTGFDARLLRAEALDLEADWLEARREVEATGSELRLWLAAPADAGLDLVDDLDASAWTCEAEAVWAEARRRRPALARAAAAESLAALRVALEERRAGVNPTVGVSMARERRVLDHHGATPTRDDALLVGLHLRLPLPVFAGNAEGIAAARLDLERARAERAAAEAEARQEVAAACAALGRVQEERSLRAEAAATAERDLALIEAAYADGRIPLDEYLTLRERLVRQQVALLDALAAVEESRARLARASGIPREELAR